MSLTSGDKKIARMARYEFTETLCTSNDIADCAFGRSANLQ